MSSPIESLIHSGTKIWLDSIDPDLVATNRKLGASGATSNPIIVADLIKTGRFDNELRELIGAGLDDDAVAWQMTDRLVRRAQEVFLPGWQETQGNDGYVSFELDPLLEAADCPLSIPDRSARYVELGQNWAKGHQNRMIKVPATPAGLGALEELSAAGVTINCTLIFSMRQYILARDAIYKGALRRPDPTTLKSVYSIFVSRIDTYTAKKIPELSSEAQGQVGIVNAQRIWQANQSFWMDKNLPRQQEIIFASMGTKNASDPADKYVSALAGSDIQTNPPQTNAAVQDLGKSYSRRVDQLPAQSVLNDIDKHVDIQAMENYLMEEGLAKFADPQVGLLKLIAQKRSSL